MDTAAVVSKDARACLYFADTASFEGLMLVGDMTVRVDAAAREKLWRPGWERYYPEGPADPDYCVLEFRARRGNYYHNLDKLWFDV
jgi:general stress protein 26